MGNNSTTKKPTSGCLIAVYVVIAVILSLLFFGFIVNTCSSASNKENITGNEQNLEANISRLKNASSVKSYTVKDSVLILEFVSNYNEYKLKNPNSGLKKKEYDDIWSDKEVKKTLISAVGKIFEKEPSIKTVETSKRYNNKTYKILVTRNRLEVFEYHIIVNANLRLGETFSDKYVYNEKGRDLFYNFFIR